MKCSTPALTPRQRQAVAPQQRYSRPATASRSRDVGEYALIRRVANSHCHRSTAAPITVSPTTLSMEVLTCVQQLDLDLCTLDVCASSRMSPQRHHRHHSPTSSDDDDPMMTTPRDNKRNNNNRHGTAPFMVNLDQPRIPRDIMLRRKACNESHFASKLRLLIDGESRRLQAQLTRVERPMLQLAQRRASAWLKVVATVRPMILLGAQLRFCRAKHILRGPFALIAARAIRRKRAKAARQNWEAEKVRRMLRPTKDALEAGIPITRHLPPAALEELLSQLTPRAFRRGEYVIYIIAGSKFTTSAVTASRPSMDATTTARTATTTKAPSPTSASARKESSGDSQKKQQQQRGSEVSAALQPLNRSIFYIHSGRVRSITFHTAKASMSDQKVDEIATVGQSVGTEALTESDSTNHIVTACTDVEAWELSVPVLNALLLQHSASVRHVLLTVAEQRRKDILRQHVLTHASIRSASPHFRYWSDSGLSAIASHVHPVLYARNEVVKIRGVLFVINGAIEVEPAAVGRGRAGDALSGSLYGEPAHTPTISGGGTSTAADKRNSDSIVRPGQCFGEVQCYFADSRRHAVKAVALTATGAWLLPKADFLEFSAHEHAATLIPLVEATMNAAASNAATRRR